jgi:hypothetical protein
MACFRIPAYMITDFEMLRMPSHVFGDPGSEVSSGG